MRTVLIFSYECVPYNRPGSTIGAQRPYQFAKYLPEFGWRCIVICCDFNRRRKIYKNDLKQLKILVKNEFLEQKNNNTIIIPLPSLREADWIDRIWWSFTGTEPKSGSHFPKGGIFGGFLRKILTLIKLFKGDHSQSWQKPAKVATNVLLDITSVDVCIGEVGPDAGIYLAHWFSRKFRKPWVIDFRDPHLKPFHGIIRNVLQFWYKNMFKKLNFSINVTPYWAKLDSELFKTKSICITNGYDHSDFIHDSSSEARGHLNILLSGSIKSEYKLSIFFEGLKKYNNISRLKKWRLIYYGNDHDKLWRLVNLYQISNISEIYQNIPRDQFMVKINDIDLLIIFSISERSNLFLKHGFYPGKIFEYMALNKPIICIPCDDLLLCQLISDLKIGRAIKDEHEFCSFLIKTENLSNLSYDFYQPDKDKINQYSRKVLTKKLAANLDLVLN